MSGEPRKSDILTTKLDYGTELFVDDLLIDTKRGVKRTLHLSTKLEKPVFTPERSWEQGGANKSKRLNLYGTVVFDEQMDKYRMWYMCRMGPLHGYTIPGLYVPRPGRGQSATFMGCRQDKYGRVFADNDRGDLTCYAESEDGLTWTRPKLGIFAFDGSLDNNIVWDLHGACVFRDEEASDPDQRYKAIGFCRRYRNIFLLSSPDGIRWDDSKWLKPVLARDNEGPFNVVYDAKEGIFRAYSHGRDTDKDKCRMVYYSESPSLEGPWKELAPMLRAESQDDQVGERKYKAIRAEIHNMSAFRYHNIHLGIVGMLYVTGPGASDMPVDGHIDAQFVHSRDGVNWRHFDQERTPIIPRGEEGSWDWGMIMGTARQPIIRNDKIHWYYNGSQLTHGLALEKRVAAIGKATWRLDGFVSLDAASEDGVVETVPLQVPAAQLEVNANAASGSLRVEVLTADGQVQTGFSKDACQLLKGDSVRHRVRWTGKALAQAQQPLRLRFLINNANLYAFRLKRRTCQCN